MPHKLDSFEVYFSHDRENEGTYCAIKDLLTDEEVATWVYRHADDRFCYQKARKFALTKALKSWPRPLRRQFWKEYAEERPQDMR